MAFSKYNIYKNKNYKKANYFFKTILEDSNIISTYKVGLEVYNIRDKTSNKVIGFLGYLISLEKLKSLTSYILNIVKKYKLKEYIILIKTIYNNKIYFITSIDTSKSEFWLLNNKDIKEEFYKYKTIILNNK